MQTLSRSVSVQGAYEGPPGRSTSGQPMRPGMPVQDRTNSIVGRLEGVEISTKGAIEALLVRTAAPIGLRTRVKRLLAQQVLVLEGRVISALSRQQVDALPDAA